MFKTFAGPAGRIALDPSVVWAVVADTLENGEAGVIALTRIGREPGPNFIIASFGPDDHAKGGPNRRAADEYLEQVVRELNDHANRPIPNPMELRRDAETRRKATSAEGT